MIYDEFVGEKWIPSKDINLDIARCALGIAGEAGEVAEHIKKALRGDDPTTPDPALDMLYELGDVLFYITRMAHYYGFTLQDIVDANVKKLDDRAQRGVLQGSGDSR